MPTTPDVNTLLRKLSEIGIALTSEQDVRKLLDNIVFQARNFCNAEGGTLYLKEGDGLRFLVAQNDVLDRRTDQFKRTSKLFESSLIPLTEDSLAGYVGVHGKLLNIQDAYDLPESLPFHFNRDFDRRNDYRTKSMLLVPMTDPQQHVLGVLGVINARAEGSEDVIAFSDRYEQLMMSLASQAAVAVRNAQLTEDLKNAYRDTVIALSVAAEFRDADTAAHIQRMSQYCRVIAEEMELPKHECEMILFASPMHDVGKLGVPDSILLKPGKLTNDEYDEMKKHTLYGERILSISKAEVLRVSREIAATHHEKWDGTGYPNGLKGEDIPLFGRIAALADVFDALSSARCYKKAFSVERALEIVDKDTGSHFDPAVVAAFMRGLPRILEIKEQFADEKLDLGQL